MKKLIFFLLIVILIAGTVFFSRKNLPLFPNNKQTTSSPPTNTTGTCMILPEEYCKEVKIIDWKYEGQSFKLAAFNLPEGTQVRSPVNGFIATTKDGDTWKGTFASIKPENSELKINYTFIGDIQFENSSASKVTTGEVFGKLTDTGAKNLGNYNLVIRITQYNTRDKKFETDESTLYSLFPK